MNTKKPMTATEALKLVAWLLTAAAIFLALVFLLKAHRPIVTIGFLIVAFCLCPLSGKLFEKLKTKTKINLQIPAIILSLFVFRGSVLLNNAVIDSMNKDKTNDTLAIVTETTVPEETTIETTTTSEITTIITTIETIIEALPATKSETTETELTIKTVSTLPESDELYDSVFVYYCDKICKEIDIQDIDGFEIVKQDNTITYRSDEGYVELKVIKNTLFGLYYTKGNKVIATFLGQGGKKYAVGNKDDNKLYIVEKFNDMRFFMFSDEPVVTLEEYVTEPPQTFPPITEAPKVITQTYILNTNTHKVHKSSCGEVNKIADENYSECNDLQWAFDNGYVGCKKCNPQN